MDSNDPLAKIFHTMISKAINDCFVDSAIYGTGYIKVVHKDGELKVENIPYQNIQKELQSAIENSKLTKLM